MQGCGQEPAVTVEEQIIDTAQVTVDQIQSVGTSVVQGDESRCRHLNRRIAHQSPNNLAKITDANAAYGRSHPHPHGKVFCAFVEGPDGKFLQICNAAKTADGEQGQDLVVQASAARHDLLQGVDGHHGKLWFSRRIPDQERADGREQRLIIRATR